MRVIAVSLLLLLSGCATGTGARWWAPATWWSHAPAEAADKAQAKRANAEDVAVKTAQQLTYETGIALAAAPASRPVAVAVASNNSALRLLDQVAGPLPVAEADRLSALVTKLLSENAEIRAQAERDMAKERGKIADVSADLAKAQEAVSAAEGKLRVAYDRENKLANELRSQRALLWIAAGVAVLMSAAWLYVKVAYGGIPAAAGLFMRDLRTKHPEAATLAEPLFDAYLSRSEQRKIAEHAQ